MSKPVLGIVLGAVLGIFDGLTALVSAPELKSAIASIVIGSTFKGIIAGAAIGWFAKKFDNLAAGVVFGLAVGLLLAFAVAAMPAENGQHYYWEIMLPGAIVGVILGYATQRHAAGRRSALAG
ncbi:MAG TPA: hypothetical protein VFX98_00510 [Longimicrobiaceae bacterium]|nr:hypothetical protein [Longimicrobiaceae bacterium]